MTSKLCLLLLGLSALVAVMQAYYDDDYDSATNEVYGIKLVDSTLSKLVKRDITDELSRDDIIEFLKSLSEEEFNAMSDEEKLGVVFLIYLYEINPKDLEKRSLLGIQKRSVFLSHATRSLKKREVDTDDDGELSREEFIHFLKHLTEEDIKQLSQEERLGLVFLIYLMDIQPHELERRSLEYFAKRSLKKREIGDYVDFNREDFIAFLKNLTPEDVMKMSDKEKMGVTLLLRLFDVQQHELE
uniref:EF-hand domain-containing protein n=1 Tax=Strigamia maritima TaxID=126957 RepID=T1JNE7_STRMM